MALRNRKATVDPGCFRCGAHYAPPPTGWWRWEDGLVGSPILCGECAWTVARRQADEDERYMADLGRWASQLSLTWRQEANAYVGRMQAEAAMLAANPPSEWRDLGLLYDPEDFPEPGWKHFRAWRAAFGTPDPPPLRKPKRRGRRNAPRKFVPDLFGLEEPTL